MPATSQREIISFPAFITPVDLIYFTDRDGDAASIVCSLFLSQSVTCYEFIYWCGQLLHIWIRVSTFFLKFPPLPSSLYYCINSLSQLTTPSSPLTCSCLLSSFCKPTVWPWTFPLSFPSIPDDPWRPLLASLPSPPATHIWFTPNLFYPPHICMCFPAVIMVTFRQLCLSHYTEGGIAGSREQRSHWCWM